MGVGGAGSGSDSSEPLGEPRSASLGAAAGRLRGGRPSRALGLAVSAASVAAATVAIYPLSHLAPVVSLSVVYLVPVLLVSTYWGLGLGLVTSLLSAARSRPWATRTPRCGRWRRVPTTTSPSRSARES